jgi:hypothetical protein
MHWYFSRYFNVNAELVVITEDQRKYMSTRMLRQNSGYYCILVADLQHFAVLLRANHILVLWF